MLQPRLVMMDAAFEYTNSCIAWIVVYVGSLSNGDILGVSKLSTLLSTEGAAMVGVKK